MREEGERKRGKKERHGRISEQETKDRGDGGEKEKKIGRYYLQKVHLFPSLLLHLPSISWVYGCPMLDTAAHVR